MRRHLAVLLVLYVTAAVAEEPVRVGGLQLGQTRGEVEALLGKPDAAVPTGLRFHTRLIFKGLTVWLSEANVVGAIESTSSKYCALVDICPGSPALDAVHQLGVVGLPRGAKRVRNGEYQGSGPGACYSVKVRNGRVKSVSTSDCYA